MSDGFLIRKHPGPRMSETPKTRQDNEYEVLKSIYDRDVTANEDSEWLDVSIALGPSHDSKNPDVYAKIVLRVVCNANYPDKVPAIALSQSRGLSSSQIELLLTQLKQQASDLCGEVMILELARTVEEFLREHNRPGPGSCYDQMVTRKMSLQLEQLKKEEDLKTKQRRDIQERIKERNAPSSDEDECEMDGRKVRFLSKELGGVQRYSVSNGEPVCDHRCCKYIQFEKKVLRGRCIVHEEDCVLYYGIDQSNGEPNTIREYSLHLSEKPTKLLVTEQLDNVQQKLEELKKISHENLVGYLDFRYVVEKDHITVYLVQEFVSNVSIAAYHSWELDVPFIRHLAIAALRALAFLHQNDVIHKNIQASSVFVSKEGVVKLSDFCLTKLMKDVKLRCRQIPVELRRFDQTTDILEMANMICEWLGTEPAKMNHLDYIPDQLKDFLDKCYLPENQRWSAQKLLNHSFLRNEVARGPCLRIRRFSGMRKTSEQADENEEDTDEILSDIPNDLKKQSRFLSEFRLLKELGSGSFGVVYKAQNRLDGQIYAIKAIQLNPKNKQLNKKMIREVKLLSKLNHENVVRYYNSWIETAIGDDVNLIKQVTSTPLQSLTDETDGLTSNGGRKISEDDDDEEEAFDGDYFDDSDDDDDDDEEDSGDESLGNQSSPDQIRQEPSESIVFEDSRKRNLSDSGNGLEWDELGKPDLVKQRKCLYIQMQFCEKSTLRIAIDEGGLCDDLKRFWRLVREIVEGLAYIHQQDMIHRDLKPVNIFLDSCDRVKIGDFGLATTSVLNRCNFIINAVNLNASETHTEDSHTGGVGTSFYVAPELQKQNGKVHYNKKVDMYSLGIILFEMAHPPFTTYMERCETLSNLRQPDVLFPPEMDGKHPALGEILRLLLNHDPVKRPTCTDLLASKHLPAPQVEESRLQDFINHTLGNSQSKAYKYLISSCFQQKTSQEEDLTYHADPPVTESHYALQETVRDAVVQIFRRRGARNVATPLLLPQGDPSSVPDCAVRLMTHSGSVVVAPRDLRVPFARLVARTNVTHMRRYCVNRVFKERRTHGYHPREAFECAFDIVSPTGGDSLADADVLCSLQDLVNALPVLKERSCVIRVNHTLLLQSLLLALGLEKMYSDVFNLLTLARDGKYSKSKLEASLVNLPLNEVDAGKLALIFQREDSLGKIKAELFGFVQRKNEANNLAKKAMEELRNIIEYAQKMGYEIPVKINPGLAHTSKHCNGIIFDMVCATKLKRKKDGWEILASGCRYDGLIQKFQRNFEVTGSISRDTTAVGVSVSLDKLTNVIKDDWEDDGTTTVVVSSIGRDAMVTAKAELLRNLRAAGLSSYVLENVESLDDLEAYGKENRISHLIWLKGSERDKARIMTWEQERERYVEKKITATEVVDFILRNTRTTAESENLQPRPSLADSSANQVLNIHILIEEKISVNSRRTRETKIKSKLAPHLGNFSSRPTIEVIGLTLDLKIIKTIASCLDYSDDSGELTIDVEKILEKNSRDKKYLIKVCDKIQRLYTERQYLVIILYSLCEDKWYVPICTAEANMADGLYILRKVAQIMDHANT